MFNIDLTGRRALVAGVADEQRVEARTAGLRVHVAELRADLDRFWLSALTAYKAAVEQPEQEVS